MCKKSVLGVSIAVLLVFVVAETSWAAECPEEWSRRNPLMDYAPQETGVYDTLYEYVEEPDCRGCHGASLADRHHLIPGACASVLCHGATPERNCMADGCHATVDNGGHHLTDLSATGQCNACHAHVVEYDSEPRPTYSPGITTPYAYSCENCHWDQALSGVHPSGGPDYDEYGKPVFTPQTLHHMGFEANFVGQCHRCHAENDPYDPSWDPCDDYECSRRIRPCQKCHSRGSLHGLIYHVVSLGGGSGPDDYPWGWHAFGWHVDSSDCADVDSTVSRQFANGQSWGDELCMGCHGDRY